MEIIQEQLKELKKLIELGNSLKKDFLTIDEVSVYLSASKSYLYQLTSQKEIPFYCPTGKKIYFKKTEIEEWIISSKVEPISDMENEVELYLSRNKKVQL